MGITKRNGSYTLCVSCGRDIYGKQIRKYQTFTPPPGLTPKQEQKAVDKAYQEFKSKVENGLIMEGRKITLLEFTERWLDEVAAQRLEARTLSDYRKELHERVLPELGHLKMSDLRPGILNSFFVNLTKDGVRKDGKPGGYSKSTIRKTRNVLSSVLSTAAEWEIIENNPLDRVRIQAKESTADKIKFFTPAQAVTFLSYIEQPYTVHTSGHQRIDDTGKAYQVGNYTTQKELPEQLRVLFNLAIYGGLRKGELLALNWSDIDFDADMLSITKAVSVVDGVECIKSPKTKTSRRDIAIPHFLTMRLKALRLEQRRYRLSVGDYWKGADWVFIQTDGKRMSYSTPYSAFHDTLVRYNDARPVADHLPVIPFHGLRHTSATLLISSNQDIRSVSNRLGHAQTSTTMNIYAHALQETDRRAADALENILVKQA